jgi:glutamine cyclotransferase
MDNDKLVLLTWRGKLLLEVSLKEGKVIRSTDYPRDGWGLTYDKDHHVLIATDGSSTLYRLDPGTYDVVSTCDVFISHDGVNSEKVALLNELEYFNGTIFANIYMDSFQFAESPNYILGIDPVTCFVTMVIPVFGLEPRRKGGAVFNGISTSSSGNLLVTGKNWNRIYELELGAKASDIDPLWSRYNVSQFYKQRLNFR